MRSGAPSRTAEYMALFRAIESTGPRTERLFEDREAHLFLSPALRAVALASRHTLLRRMVTTVIDRRWPGPRLSGVVRTREIDDLVSTAIAEGCEQLVLLGAGYDARASRLALPSDLVVFEVDHPATQARKRAALGPSARQVLYAPVDFERDELGSALLGQGFDAERRTCVLWEGVFSYLTPEAIDATLGEIVRLCPDGSVVVLTYVDERALDEQSPWIQAVRRAGEPFVTGLDPRQAQGFFAARDLVLRADRSTRDAAVLRGVDGAAAIPPFYRLASLAVQSERRRPDGATVSGAR
jgi:methyltransferase (TIGR00027 family)